MSVSAPKKIVSDEPISVSDYILVINELLSRINLKVFGEISEMKTASSGHVYFSLKDEQTGDVINCAIWSSVYRMCGVKIENGMKVILSGTADVYRARGTLTFKVKTVEPAGEGALRKAYEELKARLSEEGFFDEERKRELPTYPQKIGIITSAKGAAVHDFINNLGKFGFRVSICDSRVEGQGAVGDLLRSMRIMKKKDLDVLVIVRGGGSLQSLMAFDNEMLVREIVNFPVPVVAGIGHHEDITLAALADDVSESTPTAVANKISRGYIKAMDTVLLYEQRIEDYYKDVLYKNKEEIATYVEKVTHFFKKILDEYNQSEDRIKQVLLNSSYFLKNKREKIINIEERIFSGFRMVISESKFKMEKYEDIISGNNPEKQLSLGYAIIKKDKKVIKSIKQLKENEVIGTTFFDGEVVSTIKKIIKKNKNE